MDIIACAAKDLPSEIKDADLVISMHQPPELPKPYRLTRLRGNETVISRRGILNVPQLWLNTDNFIEEGADFMDHPVGKVIMLMHTTKLVSVGGKMKIVIHCEDGNYRAPTVAIAACAALHLKDDHRMKAEEAFFHGVSEVTLKSMDSAGKMQGLMPEWFKRAQPYLENYRRILG